MSRAQWVGGALGAIFGASLAAGLVYIMPDGLPADPQNDPKLEQYTARCLAPEIKIKEAGLSALQTPEGRTTLSIEHARIASCIKQEHEKDEKTNQSLKKIADVVFGVAFGALGAAVGVAAASRRKSGLPTIYLR